MKKDKIQFIIDNVYAECNNIDNIADYQIFEVISQSHPRLGMKNINIVYAYVCNLLFGDDISEIINLLNG